MDQAPSISLILRTKTQDRAILDLLRRMERQTLAPMETIIVDSGSAPEIVEAFRQREKTLLIEIEPQSFSSAGALNRGCAQARGELLAILSQDALPADDNYLRNLAAAFDDARVAGAYGRQTPRANDHPLNIKDLTKTYGPQSRTQTDDCWFDNCCSMIRVALWRRHAFDEQMVISEDHAWAQWAQREGLAIRYVAEAAVVHSHRRTARWLWNRFYQEGQGLARIHRCRLPWWLAAFYLAREMASDWLYLARQGRWGQFYLPLLDRPVKYAALYWGYRRGERITNYELR